MAKDNSKRVVLLADTVTHMMPALAREMARRNHNLVIGNPADGLEDELKGLGADVAVVPGVDDLTQPDAVQKLITAAQKRFGGFQAACIRTGTHKTGTILEATAADAQVLYEGNFLAPFYALKALLPPLVAQGNGQVVINTSATGLRPSIEGTVYSAMRAAANSLIRASALSVAGSGVTLNATGTYALDYPAFIKDIGASDPAVRKKAEASIPMGRFGRPEEVAHFVATLIDGVGTFQTAAFFPMGGGWTFE